MVAFGVALGGTSEAVRARTIAPVRPAASAVVRPPQPPRGAGVPDVPWLVQRGDGRWIHGHGDQPGLRVLPAAETGLAIDDRFVATTRPVGDGRSFIRIRERGTGKLVREVAAGIWVSAGAWTRLGLVVTGYGDSSMAMDGGLELIGPDDGAVTALVAPGPFSAEVGQPVARGDVLVSPSGEAVASNACGVERCDLQVVDLATRAVTRPVHDGPGFLRALTDDAVITTDDAYRWIVARAIGDGREQWRIRDSALIDPLAIGGGSIVGLVGSARTGFGIASIDATGRMRDLTARARGNEAWPRLWTALSARTSVVIGEVPFDEAFGASRALGITVVDPVRGGSSEATVSLPSLSEAVR